MATPRTVGSSWISSGLETGSGPQRHPHYPQLIERHFGPNGALPSTMQAPRNEGSLRLVMLQDRHHIIRAVLHCSDFTSLDFADRHQSALEHVRQCLREAGFDGHLVTPALAPRESQELQKLGFVVTTSLVLLRRSTFGRSAPRRARKHPSISFANLHSWPFRVKVNPQDFERILTVDGAAFPEGEAFDHLALTDALRATPQVRVRVAVNPSGELVGYAISGVAGRRGYLQRLAVHPIAQQQSIGRMLCLDSVRWAARHSATAIAVNTKPTNSTALNLYARCGFERLVEPIHVLSLDLSQNKS